MSWQAVVMYLVVAFVGLPAALRNVTALALLVAWLVPEILWLSTGDSLPLKLYFMADVAVIAAIYAKTTCRLGPRAYPSITSQFRGMVLDLTLQDRWIIAIFLFGAWPLYALNVHPWWKWTGLWGLVICQFLLAGAEALSVYRAARRKRSNPTPIIDRHLVVVPFPLQRRGADAVRKTPETTGAMLTAIGSGGGSG